jgi:hypothetical protein
MPDNAGLSETGTVRCECYPKPAFPCRFTALHISIAKLNHSLTAVKVNKLLAYTTLRFIVPTCCIGGLHLGCLPAPS